MLTVDPEIEEIQRTRSESFKTIVTFRRRFWDIELQDFVLEAGETQLPTSDIKRIGPTRENLDNGKINEFKSSNVTITLHNEKNEWSANNASGRFAKDTIARLGYESQLTEFKVQVFYEKKDGTDVPVLVFIGRAAAYNFQPKAKTVDIALQSKHVLLSRANAENVSISVADEVLVGAVDGINTTFFTVNTGVGRVLDVRSDGASRRLGVDVQISQLNQFDQPAKVEFTNPPGIGQDLRSDYFHWLKTQKIEDLVALLAAEAGLTPGETDISPVFFTDEVINQRVFSSSAEFDTGALQNIDTQSPPGEIKRAWYLLDDFSDFDFTNNPTWQTQKPSPPGVIVVPTFGEDIGRLKLLATSSSPVIAALPHAATTGTWGFRAFSQDDGRIYFMMTTDALVAQDPSGNGYAIIFFPNSQVPTAARFVRVDGGSFTTLFNLTGTWGVGSVVDDFYEYRVTRSADGLWTIFVDFNDGNGLVLAGSATDNTYTAGNFFMVTHHNNASGFQIHIDDIHFSPSTFPTPPITAMTNLDAIWESTVIDGTTSFGKWLNIVTSSNSPPGTGLIVETASAPESFPGSGVPGAFAAFVAVGIGGQVLSAQDRFLKWRVRLTPVLGDPDFTSTTVFDTTLTFKTSTTKIAQANFTGLTVFGAIQRLGEIANYEWGFSRAGILFFRERSFDKTVDFTINLSDVKEFNLISDGTDRVFNEIVATYGVHSKIVNPINRLDPRPNSFDRNGEKRLTVGSTQILIDPDADVATGLAISYFEDNKNRRRRIQIVIDFKPQLELSDTILVQYFDAEPNPPWHIGDTSRAIGDQDIQLYGEGQQSAAGFLGRIISVSHMESSKQSRLELEELI